MIGTRLPRADLSLAGNFLYMLRGTVPDPLSVRLLDKAFILHADHELKCVDVYAARVSAATLTDLHSAVVAAICAPKVALHAGANEQVMKMLNEIGHPTAWTRIFGISWRPRKKIMGFGHAVYKNVEDPRAKHLREMSRQLGN